MSLPLMLPRPVSPAGFTLETRRLLGRLPRQPGLWVMAGEARREDYGEAAGQTRLRPAGRDFPRLPSGQVGGQAARLAHYFLLGALVRGERALFLDAANCFNPHRLAAMIARVNELRTTGEEKHRAGRGPAPTQTRAEELLARVHLSRAFTCFQLAELVERVPAAAGRWGARCVFLTGVPEIFDDEELEAAEARRVFGRALATMRRWCANQRHLQLSTLVFNAVLTSLHAPRRWLWTQLERAADGVFRFQETPQGLAVRGGEKLPALCAPSAFSAPLR